MEKYRKFADHTTGINPFVPAYTNSKNSIIVYILRAVVEFQQSQTLGALVASLRLIIFTIVLVFALFLNCILIKLLHVPTLQKSISTMVNKIFFKFVLYSFGFYSINEDNSNPTDDYGSLILCNRASPIDIIYLLSVCTPKFTQMIFQSEQGKVVKTLFRPLSFFDTVQSIFRPMKYYPVEQSLPSDMSLGEIKLLVETREPILIFFEGVQTNQLAVLEPPPTFIQDLSAMNFSQDKLSIISLKYPNRGTFTPINTTRNQLWHLFLMLTSFSNELTVHCQQVQNQQDYKKTISAVYDSQGYKMVGVDYKVLYQFLSYWEKTKGTKNYSKNE